MNIIHSLEGISPLTKLGMRKISQTLTSTFFFAIQTFCFQNEEKIKYERLLYVRAFLVQLFYLEVLRI